MRKTRGFRLGHKLVKVFKWSIIHQRTKPRTYQRLNQPSSTIKAMSKLCDWGRALKHGAKGLCFPKSKSKSDYIRVGQEHDPIDAKQWGVPKGHLAVYVGEKEGDTHRYLVPVIYFNHPLFGNLLEEAVKEYSSITRVGSRYPVRYPSSRTSRPELPQPVVEAAVGGGAGGFGDVLMHNYCTRL